MVLARTRCLQDRGGKHLPSPGSAGCQGAALAERGLSGRTQPLSAHTPHIWKRRDKAGKKLTLFKILLKREGL